jgi:CAAX protease family protein
VNVAAALGGLAVIWGGTALLVSPAARVLGDEEQIRTNCLAQLCLWGLFAVTLAIVVSWEREPLASLWLRPLEWQSVLWGLLLACVSVVVIGPAREWVRRAVGLAGFAPALTRLMRLPLWFRVAAAITAGIVEETLFSGYTITRVGFLTGSLWVAGALSVAAFAAVHIPTWGAGPALSIMVGGAVNAAFFIWRQDLLALIVAHAGVDLWGFVIAPLYSAWWLDGRYS